MTSQESSAQSATSEPVDLTSSPHSLHRAVYARRKEYVRPHRIQIKIGTWNVAACPGTDKDLAGWFIGGRGVDRRLAGLDHVKTAALERGNTDESLESGPEDVRLVGGDKIGLYVLGLQEVVDLNVANQYMSRIVYTDPSLPAVERWRSAMEEALPAGYQLISSEQMSGLLLLIYASADIALTIDNVSTSAIGTGVLGYLGNKGAVSTRIVLGEATRMVFVNSHLASGNDASYLDRRCWDVATITARTQFQPINRLGVQEDEGDKIGDEDFAFWFGDLNFRIDDLPGDDIRRLLMLHTRGEYGVGPKRDIDDVPIDGNNAVVVGSSRRSDSLADEDGSGRHGVEDTPNRPLPDPDNFLPAPAEDPASLQATLDSLLPHDQLRRAMKERKAFHDGWQEGLINFLPSYKYDVGTVGLFDSSEKRRAPSWCDRILFRTRSDRYGYEKRIKEEEDARRKDEDMTARGIDHAGDEDEVLFDYDPENDGDDQPRDNARFDYDEGADGDGGGAVRAVITEEGFVDRIRLDIYTSHQRVQSSDHKPVISVFTLDYDAVVPGLKARVHAEVARELDRAENEGRPGVTIVIDGQESGGASAGDPYDDSVDFGELAFMRAKSRSLTVANTGRVSATFSFVQRPTTDEVDDAVPGPPWLSTTFARPDSSSEEGGEVVDLGLEVVLEPGETVTALLEALVDELSHVRMLNDGQSVLDDVLVLRVSEGRDHFIPVRATWSPTCVGRSMDELIRIPDGGIRQFIRSRSTGRAGPSGSIPYELEVHCAAPKELFKLLEAAEMLAERVMADEQMLQQRAAPRDRPGWPFESPSHEIGREQVARLVGTLDDDRPINDAFDGETSSMARLEAVGNVLVLFLWGLTDGIVSIPLWMRLEQASIPSLASGITSSRSAPEVEEDKTTILDVLAAAPNHNIAFVFLTTTLAKMILELTPPSKTEVDTPKWSVRGIGSIGRRSVGFRRSTGSPSAEAHAQTTLERRQARERRWSEILGSAACRGPKTTKDKEQKMLEDKQRALMQLFLRRPADEAVRGQ